MAAPVNRFKQSLKEGRQTIGCWLTQGTAIAAQIAATADFDWLLIDTEHSPNDLPSVLTQLQAIAGYDASAAVRPHVGETHVIKQILDMGCQTLIVPMWSPPPGLLRRRWKFLIRAFSAPIPKQARSVSCSTPFQTMLPMPVWCWATAGMPSMRSTCAGSGRLPPAMARSRRPGSALEC